MQIGNARLRGRRGRWTLDIDAGRIERIAPAGAGPAAEAAEEEPDGLFCADPYGHRPGATSVSVGQDPERVEAGGRLVVAPFVENHCRS